MTNQIIVMFGGIKLKTKAFIASLVSQHQWLGSSQNAEEISLTVKGILLSLIPLFVTILGIFNVQIAQTEIVEFLNAIFAVVSAVIILYGLVRKLIVRAKE